MKRFAQIAFGLSAFALLVSTFDRVAERGRFATSYSSYGSGPQGTRGLYLLVEQLVAPVTRWAQDLARLPANAVLVALGGCDAAMARPVSRYERQELVRWVRAGGVLVVAGARDYLPQAFGVQFKFDARCKRQWDSLLEGDSVDEERDAGPAEADGGVPELAASEPSDAGVAADASIGVSASSGEPLEPADTTWAIPMSPSLRGLPVVPFRSAGELVLMPDLEPEVLLGDPRRDAEGLETDLQPLALSVKHGLGRVIVLASASMLQNAELGSSDGGELFVRLLRHYAPNMPVVFDEYHLGIGERRSLMLYLRQMGAAPLALQLAILIALVLWRAGARFGAVLPPAPPLPPESASFVNALGQLYERSADARGAIELIARDAWIRIALHHHVDVAPPARLVELLRARGADVAADAVWEIDAAAKSEGATNKLPALIARIDAALGRALA